MDMIQGMECAMECTLVETFRDYSLLYCMTVIVGLLLVILVCVWTSTYRGGFAWINNTKLQFNWHPLLMVIGFIFIFGNCILLYRTFRNSRKIVLKIFHSILHAISFIFISVSLRAVFDSHNYAESPIPNLYSLHSWIGLLAVVIFITQLIFGVIMFFCSSVSHSVRKIYLEFHVFFGILAFVLSCAAALSGLTEKALFSVKNYHSYPVEGIIINFIGICIVVFGSLTVFLVTRAKYKRQPLPEDAGLLRSCPHEHK